ncbi:MAG: bifunctional diaminohydroxyphosphoribosylaminopyrimidine deaminase/5-amino-6-(5-phosphoribosylamino)uracil reductase RibD [Alphaproteobacteria bacterium]|nr:bifunctional diaminohydroxyphosphoribosylaminopyrimidine deaminase/5-amino-6-(5-phosphoribosylamino)uracil reductase RibD [Alphaproteobacteria bacterium]
MQINPYDLWHMKSALNLARTGLGLTWPNPSVGCVIIKDGHVVGRGRSGDGGRPHAETVALNMAGKHAKGAFVYVTLEPCAHHGKTPPCAQALIDAGVSKVIIATEDTDDRVSGKGIEMLRAAGIEVVVGIMAEQARDLNKGFFLRHAEQRPLISLKTATTLDAKIATSTGESKWITGELARKRAHLLRVQHDAIAVGVNTIISDNPQLNSRLNGIVKNQVRIIFDTHLRLKGTEKIFENLLENPVWVVTTIEATSDKARPLVNAGADLITVSKNADGKIDLSQAMNALCARGITRLLVEGGANLMTSFMKLGLYDTLYWFKAGSVIGADGLNAAQALGIAKIDQKIRLTHSEQIILGEDVLDIYKRTA